MTDYFKSIRNRPDRAIIKDDWILRARGKEGIGRALFCALPGRELMVLNTFIKKSKKTPHKELEMARKRMREVVK